MRTDEDVLAFRCLIAYPFIRAAFKMNLVIVSVSVLFYIQLANLDWVIFPLYAVVAMAIGCGTAVLFQILPWPARGTKELLEAIGKLP